MDKVDIWLLIADNWFEADESVNSEKYINLAAHQMHLIDPNHESHEGKDAYNEETRIKALTLMFKYQSL